MNFLDLLESVLVKNGLITAFVFVGVVVWVSYFLSDKFSDGKFHGSAIAIMLGLVLAYLGGFITGGKNGLADITFFSGIGLLGGAMIRDFAIVATAYGVRLEELKKAGAAGILSLFYRCHSFFLCWRCYGNSFWLFGCRKYYYHRCWYCYVCSRARHR